LVGVTGRAVKQSPATNPKDLYDMAIHGSSKERDSHPYSLLIALVAISCSFAIAACGSSGRPSGPAASGDPALKEAQCMRSHGVPNFPDPTAGGPSVIPNWINPQAPAFQTAQKACAKFLVGGSGQGSASESRKLELLNLAKCMRSHGLPSFPDPTSSPPPAGSHTGNVVGGGGVYLALPHQSPALNRASAACGFRIS
jgi:hypothetical protein